MDLVIVYSKLLCVRSTLQEEWNLTWFNNRRKLLDRAEEADMLNRGRPEKSFVGAR